MKPDPENCAGSELGLQHKNRGVMPLLAPPSPQPRHATEVLMMGVVVFSCPETSSVASTAELEPPQQHACVQRFGLELNIRH
jgi:hypothetical protein